MVKTVLWLRTIAADMTEKLLKQQEKYEAIIRDWVSRYRINKDKKTPILKFVIDFHFSWTIARPQMVGSWVIVKGTRLVCLASLGLGLGLGLVQMIRSRRLQPGQCGAGEFSVIIFTKQKLSTNSSLEIYKFHNSFFSIWQFLVRKIGVRDEAVAEQGLFEVWL
jgi:hypothetical protein